jgi:hypothetical protein
MNVKTHMRNVTSRGVVGWCAFVRSLSVVFDPPGLDGSPRVRHGEEPVFVQALVTEATVEALDVGVLDRLAGTDKAQAHSGLVRPGIEHLAFELRSVIHRDRQRQSAQIRQPLEHRHDPLPSDRRINLEHQALAAEVIHDRKASQPSAVAQTITDEVHRPTAVHGGRLRQRLALEQADSLAFSPANGEPRLAIQSVRAFAIDRPPLSA